MTESLTINVLDVGALAVDHNVPDLPRRLAVAAVPILTLDERQVVPEQHWKVFVGAAIRAYEPEHPGLLGPEAEAVDGVVDWGDWRRQQLERNPRLQSLLDAFTQFVQERLPGTVWQQHRWTRTYVTPDGRKWGLKLRSTKGLLLYATRGGKQIVEYVRTPADFESAVNGLVPN